MSIKKFNNKAFTLPEIIVCIVLLSTLSVFMFRLLAEVTSKEKNDDFAFNNQLNKMEIEEYLHNLFIFNNPQKFLVKKNSSDASYHLYISWNSKQMYDLSLQKNDNNKYYFIVYEINSNDVQAYNYTDSTTTSLDSNKTVIKKWELKDVTSGYISYQNINDNDENIEFVIKLYTDSEDNNYVNNNAIDDLHFRTYYNPYVISENPDGNYLCQNYLVTLSQNTGDSSDEGCTGDYPYCYQQAYDSNFYYCLKKEPTYILPINGLSCDSYDEEHLLCYTLYGSSGTPEYITTEKCTRQKSLNIDGKKFIFNKIGNTFECDYSIGNDEPVLSEITNNSIVTYALSQKHQDNGENK